MTPFDSHFLKKAIEQGYVAPRQAPRFMAMYQQNPGQARNIAAFLVAREIVTTAEANEILKVLRLESQMGSAARTRKIGEYEILSKLGEGGMGEVYKGKGSKGLVAIKVIAKECSEQKEFIQRFMREIEVTLKLKHPNIVQSLDYGVDTEEDLFFAVQEFVEGVSLEDYLSKRGKLNIPEALNVVGQVAQGLVYAEEQNIIHRDIKPANLLIGKGGVVKIADFGLAKDKNQQSITQTGSILGTPAYMAPEQARGEKIVDIRADVYSLGIVLFEMLTGDVPYDDPSPLRVCLMHDSVPMPRLNQYIGSAATQVQPLLDKMTEKDCDDRYTSEELVRALRSHRCTGNGD